MVVGAVCLGQDGSRYRCLQPTGYDMIANEVKSMLVKLGWDIACAVLGLGTMLVQRSCRCMSFAGEDAIAKIPERFSRQVLGYQEIAMIRELSVYPFAPASRHCGIECLAWRSRLRLHWSTGPMLGGGMV